MQGPLPFFFTGSPDLPIILVADDVGRRGSGLGHQLGWFDDPFSNSMIFGTTQRVGCRNARKVTADQLNTLLSFWWNLIALS